MSDKPKRQEYGAIWIKTGKDGKKFLSGVLSPNGKDGEKINIVAWKNDYKTEDRHPDYKIFLSAPRDAAPKDDFADDVPF